VTSLQTPDGPPIQFVGYEERQRLIRALLRKKVAPPEVIQFALNAEKLLTTEGSVRNTMMLLTGGQYILQTDDDTYCAYVSANANDESVTLTSEADPYQTYFYPDRKSNLAEFPINPDVDPFSIHESVLGKSLSDVLNDRKSVLWDKINPHAFAGQYAGNSRIDITKTGASGDPGMSTCLGFLTSAPVDTLKRVYSTPNSYRWATEGRELLRLVSELTICRYPVFQAMSFGINNTRLQPPFFPLGRNLDGAFALLYHLSDGMSFIGHIPFAISHQSEPDRRYAGRAADFPCRLRLTDILQTCLTSFSFPHDVSRSQSLRCIGEQLIALGIMSRVAFRSFLRNRYAQSRFELISGLKGIVQEKYFGCHEWVNDIESISNSIQCSILEDGSTVPADLVPKLNPEEALDKAQSCILLYGRMMLHWEELTAAAGEIGSLAELRRPSLAVH
jgi:hypothetical protein